MKMWKFFHIFGPIMTLPGLTFAQCTPTTSNGFVATNACTFPNPQFSLDTNYKVQQYNITWPDRATDTRNNNGNGQCFKGTTCTAPLQEIDCWAQFDSPVGQSNGSWSEVVHDAQVVGKSGKNSNGQQCYTYSCKPTGST
jgi:hypothetical protein